MADLADIERGLVSTLAGAFFPAGVSGGRVDLRWGGWRAGAGVSRLADRGRA